MKSDLVDVTVALHAITERAVKVSALGERKDAVWIPLSHVEGMLCTRSWEDQSGQKRYATEVVLKAFGGDLVLMPQGNGSGGRPGAGGPDDYGRESSRTDRSSETSRGNDDRSYERDLDDEIPF